MPNAINAHPHATDRVAVVHNGIIENYKELKQELQNIGYQFKSETDTEIITNLLDYYLSLNNDPKEASMQTIGRLEGSFSVVFMFKSDKFLFSTSRKTSLILGLAENAIYIASDVVAFGNKVNNVIYLEDGDKAMVSLDSYQIFDKNNNPAKRPLRKFSILEEVTKNDFPHFMLKEIYQQSVVLEQTITRYLTGNELDKVKIDWNKIDSIKILACGTAYYSGLVAKY